MHCTPMIHQETLSFSCMLTGAVSGPGPWLRPMAVRQIGFVRLG
ncbi:MAG: hypothetical protein H6Q31_3190, partial [Bacteroidetes bacterium]|nr:hypothetical protein [Bacteroidota bacterium]